MQLIKEQEGWLVLRDADGKIVLADKEHFIGCSYQYLTDEERDKTSSYRRKRAGMSKEEAAMTLVIPRWKLDYAIAAEGVERDGQFFRRYTMNDVLDKLDDILWTQDSDARLLSIVFRDGSFACFSERDDGFDSFCGQVCDFPTWDYYELGDWVRISSKYPFAYEKLERLGYSSPHCEAEMLEPAIRFTFEGGISLLLDSYTECRLAKPLAAFAIKQLYTPLPFKYGYITDEGRYRLVEVYDWTADRKPAAFLHIPSEDWTRNEQQTLLKVHLLNELASQPDSPYLQQLEYFLRTVRPRELLVQAQVLMDEAHKPFYLYLYEGSYELSADEREGVRLQIPYSADGISESDLIKFGLWQYFMEATSSWPQLSYTIVLEVSLRKQLEVYFREHTGSAADKQ